MILIFIIISPLLAAGRTLQDSPMGPAFHQGGETYPDCSTQIEEKHQEGCQLPQCLELDLTFTS
jgi:hypothetical protein